MIFWGKNLVLNFLGQNVPKIGLNWFFKVYEKSMRITSLNFLHEVTHHKSSKLTATIFVKKHFAEVL